LKSDSPKITQKLPFYFCNAVVAATLAHPLLTLRNRSQFGLGVTWRPRELFQGCCPTALSVAVTYSLISTAMQAIEQQLNAEHQKNSLGNNLRISFIAGFSSCLIAVPIEQTVLLSHTKKDKSPTTAFIRIINSKGPRHLYHGFMTSTIRNTLIAMFLRELPEKKHSTYEYNYAILLSAATGFITTPFETIRCGQQLAAHSGYAFRFGSNPLFKGALWRASWFSVVLLSYSKLNEMLLPPDSLPPYSNAN
jgi:hypothetical protein